MSNTCYYFINFYMKTQSKLILATSIIISLASMYIAATKANATETIKVYSERQPFLIEPLIKEYEKSTGNKIEWIFSKKGLVQKTILEKSRPVADIFLSSDIARLVDITEAEANFEIPFQKNVPKNLQSKNCNINKPKYSFGSEIDYSYD